MRKLMGIGFWVAAAAVALFPMIAEAKLAANHNETLVRGDA